MSFLHFHQEPNNSSRNLSNSISLICLLASNNFSASAPAQYLQLGFCALAILRAISATTFGSEPFATAALDLSIMLFVISAKDEILLFSFDPLVSKCCSCSCCCIANFFGRYMLELATSVLIAPVSIMIILTTKGATSCLKDSV